MALFKRRSPAAPDQGSSATANDPLHSYGEAGQTPPYGEPAPAQQYEGTGAAPQYDRSGNPQYETTGNPQHERANEPARERAGAAPADRPGNQQRYDRTGGAQYERGNQSRQAAGPPRAGATARRRGGLPGGWLGEIILGLATVAIGLIVVVHPMHSLTVLAVLLGVLLVISGVYHVVRSLRSAGDHRMWGGIAGVLFFLTGIYLLRHVGLTLSIIALFAGFAFVIAGISALAEAISGRSRFGRLWSALFGIICLFAGIAAITTPIHTLERLAIVLGWAFVAMGIMHIIGAFVSRKDAHEEARSGAISVPGQRATEPANVEGAYGTGPEEARAGASSGASPRHRRS